MVNANNTVSKVYDDPKQAALRFEDNPYAVKFGRATIVLIEESCLRHRCNTGWRYGRTLSDWTPDSYVD